MIGIPVHSMLSSDWHYQSALSSRSWPHLSLDKTYPANNAGAEKPDGWWAPRFELDSGEKFGPVSLVGSPSRR